MKTRPEIGDYIQCGDRKEDPENWDWGKVTAHNDDGTVVVFYERSKTEYDEHPEDLEHYE